MFGSKGNREEFIHEATLNPQFGVLTGGGPRLTDSNGVPWQGSYVNANGDLTVDLRSDIAAESRAKIVYEYLMQFTEDPYVLETLNFLMTREVAHFQQFEAALDTIRRIFLPACFRAIRVTATSITICPRARIAAGRGTRARASASMRHGSMSMTRSGRSTGRTGCSIRSRPGTDRTLASVEKADKQLGKKRSAEIDSATPLEDIQWSRYAEMAEEIG